MGRSRIDGLQGRCQPGTAISHDKLELASFQAAPIEIPSAVLPTPSGSLRAPGEPQQVPRAIRQDAIGHQELDPFA
jgi:hypothetical protein